MAHLGHHRQQHLSLFSSYAKKHAWKNLALDITMTLTLMALFTIIGYFAREFALDLQTNFFGL